MTDEPQQIFISYSKDVEHYARRLADALRAQGLTPWLDAEQLEPGQSWEEGIRKGINDSDAFAVLVGNASSAFTTFQQSEILKHGWEHAQARVLPVLFGDAETPGFLRDREAARVDPETGDGLDHVVEMLRTAGTEDLVTRTPEGDARLNERLSQLDAQAAVLADES